MLKNLDWLYKRVKISPYNNKWEWILLKDFIYEIGYKWSWDIIHIPAGFVFNWASIPRLFHIISTPMSSDTIIPALIHDYLYSTKQFDLTTTDDLFYEVMVVCWVWKIKAILLYVWLRIWSWYVRNRK
jgi:hypothetical protein